MRALAGISATLLGVAVFSETGRAQCPSTSSPLQSAIDAALPGDVILIPDSGDNLGCTVCVTKPLTFVGNSGGLVTIEASSNGPLGCPGPGCMYTGPTGVFYIAPSVSGEVVFHNLRVVGKICNSTPDAVMRGIYANAPNATVVIDHCQVEGGDYELGVPGDAFANGASGIQGNLARLVLLESSIRGGDGFQLGGTPLGTAGSGGHAVDISGEVVVARSLLLGGNGGDAIGFSFGGFCNLTTPGPGGSAAVSSSLVGYESLGLGGFGGVQFDCSMQPVGLAPNGQGFASAEPAPLHRAGSQPQPGDTIVLTLQNPSGLFGAIATSLTGWSSGTLLPGHGTFFLGSAPVFLSFGTGLTTLALPVPPDPTLVGGTFPLQAAIGDPLTFQLTNPEFVVIR